MKDRDRRLIEDYITIQAVSAEASREKSVRKSHVSALHLRWARRPLVACRAAIYGALVPTSQFEETGEGPRTSGQARVDAAMFIQELCRYPGSTSTIDRARRHIWQAHAARLSDDTGSSVAAADIAAGRAPRPKVLDMFAGGGSIPLEALRLGCDAYALDVNPVAHIIELCTLVFEQSYGPPDGTQPGSAKDGTWAGLVDETRHWARWVLERTREEIGDVYPAIPDPQAPVAVQDLGELQLRIDGPDFEPTGQQRFATRVPGSHLTPVAYLWTRTVRCKNHGCAATVPLVRQTWLCKKAGRYVALRPVARPGATRVRFEVVEAPTESAIGFDPAAFSREGNATCFFCGTVADADYVQRAGQNGEVKAQLMAVVGTKPGRSGKSYISADDLPSELLPQEQAIRERVDALCRRTRLTVPNEEISPVRPSPNARGLSAVTRHGLRTFGDLFTPRQMLALLTFTAAVRDADGEMRRMGYEERRATAVTTLLGALVDRLADFNSSLCVFNFTGGRGVKNTFGRQALPMVWDFAETNVFNPDAASWVSGIDDLPAALRDAAIDQAAVVERGSAVSLPWPDSSFDAIITDPPYYDNVPYADISDFFYVWLRRTLGHLYPDHFATDLAPKRSEATALASRHRGDMEKAKAEYEDRMARSFEEAFRTLKPGGPLVVVYAHKTTLGWATLIEALRRAGFTVTEAWPLDTERPGRLLAQDTSALASSIFLVARKREQSTTGSYEHEVRPELELIVRERVETLWEMGIAGADLVIAAVGAGLRAFTRYGTVEYANGDPVPAERFLAEVEGVVLDTLLEKIFGVSGSGVSSVDGPSRFYVLWRFTYKTAELEAGEAIVFTYSQPVELDGSQGLSTGGRALVQRKQTNYRLLDFTERGPNERLGLPDRAGQPASLIDVLHRVLWLMEHDPRSLPRFLDEARPDHERLRLLAQTLLGAGLRGKSEDDGRALIATTGPEQAALAKLAANWRSLIEQQLPTAYGPLFRSAI